MTEQEWADKIDGAKAAGLITEEQWNDLDTVGECLFNDHGKITDRHLAALNAAFHAATAAS